MAKAWVPLGLLACFALLSISETRADDDSLKLLSDRLRLQGVACQHPKDAVRDAAASKPHESVWTIICDSGAYRLRLIPDMAAHIEKIDK